MMDQGGRNVRHARAPVGANGVQARGKERENLMQTSGAAMTPAHSSVCEAIAPSRIAGYLLYNT